MDEQREFIIGRNSVREAIRSGEQIDKIFFQQGLTDGSIRELLMLARGSKLVIVEVPRAKLDELCAGMGAEGHMGNHQGVVAQVPAFAYSEMEDIFALAEERGEPPFIVILDSIQDPHNLGAVIRSAEALGAHGVVIGKRRAASLTTAAFKVSCGAAQYIPVVKVTNINHTIEDLKKKNVWMAAADMDGQPLAKTDLKGPYALVIGGESEGVARLTKELCDVVVKIEMPGKTTSLNAACAASILMYEKRRQDMAGK
ncbi:23S rRNA (guanosine(2251)-2'-O)-methyltransferase RlmB [Christensenella timonensis]|uniref:23S rRNA (guanosine(2251)-2'-O)-methyltransferase RlmB n=1 Tax=Christensenella timonensis TaxID=1816678 RepID=UPI00083279F6|nr:23S rRNA (guanosine(2251)-2'-O)-methyltransferase RlmB [Christensenella timonensis]